MHPRYIVSSCFPPPEWNKRFVSWHENDYPPKKKWLKPVSFIKKIFSVKQTLNMYTHSLIAYFAFSKALRFCLLFCCFIDLSASCQSPAIFGVMILFTIFRIVDICLFRFGICCNSWCHGWCKQREYKHHCHDSGFYFLHFLFSL